MSDNTKSTATPAVEGLTDEQVDRMLGAYIPGGSSARDWFLPHELPQGLVNVRNVVRAMFAASPVPMASSAGDEREALRACIAALEVAESEMRDWHCEHPARKQISDAIDDAQAALSTPAALPAQATGEKVCQRCQGSGTGELTAEQKNALKEEGWRAAIEVHSRHGMAGWSSHKDATLSAPQEASKVDVVANEAAFYVSNIDLRRIAGGGLKRGEVMVSVAPFDFFTAVYLRPTQQVLSSSTPQLSDEEIDAHWDSLPSIKIHNEATSRGLRTEVLLRRCFARSILAAAGGREK